MTRDFGSNRNAYFTVIKLDKSIQKQISNNIVFLSTKYIWVCSLYSVDRVASESFENSYLELLQFKNASKIHESTKGNIIPSNFTKIGEHFENSYPESLNNASKYMKYLLATMGNKC